MSGNSHQRRTDKRKKEWLKKKAGSIFFEHTKESIEGLKGYVALLKKHIGENNQELSKVQNLILIVTAIILLLVIFFSPEIKSENILILIFWYAVCAVISLSVLMQPYRFIKEARDLRQSELQDILSYIKNLETKSQARLQNA